jgi:hypothetical protein
VPKARNDQSEELSQSRGEAPGDATHRFVSVYSLPEVAKGRSVSPHVSVTHPSKDRSGVLAAARNEGIAETLLQKHIEF